MYQDQIDCQCGVSWRVSQFSGCPECGRNSAGVAFDPRSHPMGIFADFEGCDSQSRLMTEEIRRRHEADAAELEQYRKNLRAEILANKRAEELVDKLADALGRLAALLEETTYRGTDGELYFERADDGLLLEGGAAAVVEAKAALVAAGKI